MLTHQQLDRRLPGRRGAGDDELGELELPRVPQGRRGSGVHPEHEVESDGLGHGGNGGERQARFSALDPPHRRRRHAGSRGNPLRRHRQCRPRERDLCADAFALHARSSSAATGSHAWEVWRASIFGRLPGSAQLDRSRDCHLAACSRAEPAIYRVPRSVKCAPTSPSSVEALEISRERRAADPSCAFPAIYRRRRPRTPDPNPGPGARKRRTTTRPARIP